MSRPVLSGGFLRFAEVVAAMPRGLTRALRPLPVLYALAALNIADATLTLLWGAGAPLLEANPLMRGVMHYSGPWGFLALKALLSAVLVSVAPLVTTRPCGSWVVHLATLVCVAYAAVLPVHVAMLRGL